MTGLGFMLSFYGILLLIGCVVQYKSLVLENQGQFLHEQVALKPPKREKTMRIKQSVSYFQCPQYIKDLAGWFCPLNSIQLVVSIRKSQIGNLCFSCFCKNYPTVLCVLKLKMTLKSNQNSNKKNITKFEKTFIFDNSLLLKCSFFFFSFYQRIFLFFFFKEILWHILTLILWTKQQVQLLLFFV